MHYNQPTVAGVRITVADGGTGIPRELRSTLFEPFVSTKGEKGTDLGLWVVRGVVAKHHGKLSFRSSVRPESHGTTFSIYLPAVTPDHPTLPVMTRNAMERELK
jgi:two-component system, NtrC family, sensor kinase